MAIKPLALQFSTIDRQLGKMINGVTAKNNKTQMFTQLKLNQRDKIENQNALVRPCNEVSVRHQMLTISLRCLTQHAATENTQI